MQLEYFGHSFWKVSSEKVSIVIDPFEDIGYPMPKNLQSDYVIVSHEHFDHNNTSLVKGIPKIIRTSGEHDLQSFSVTLLPVFHDPEMGAKRGINHIIKICIDGLTIVHCGDLGHIPAFSIMEKIKNPDILLIPVGEVYTLSISDAWKTIDYLQPTLLFPMHYSAPELSLKIGSLSSFLGDRKDVTYHKSNLMKITSDLLSSPKTIIMDWSAVR